MFKILILFFGITSVITSAYGTDEKSNTAVLRVQKLIQQRVFVIRNFFKNKPKYQKDFQEVEFENYFSNLF